MTTTKQKRVAKLIIENAILDEPLNGGEMLEKVGYSEHLVKQPSRVLESEGVKEELANLGFTEEGAKGVVNEILYDKDVEPNARLKATDQVFKVHGSYAPDKNINLNIAVESIDPTDPEVLEAMKLIQSKLEKQ